MPENILVVEYEPRYADRVRQALAGQPFNALYAKDGEEAMRALDTSEPKLIVLSSVVPKISAPDLIRAIRGRPSMQKTPILLTVSGYTGSAPKMDASRMGASDILPKPYTESEFLGKVQQMLGVGQMTSTEIFGDLLEDSAIAHPAAKKAATSKDEIDKMLDATLAGVRAKTQSHPPRTKTSPGTVDLDKRLQDTLSGLEKSVRRTSPGTTPVPQPAVPSPAPAPAAAAPAPLPRMRTPLPDRIPVSQPVFPAAAPATTVAAAREEEEPADGVRFGQYVLVEKIATGGMAEVWKARMKGVEGFQKVVAIKKILPHLSDNHEFIDMFVDEAKLAAQLNHNNIVHIYDLGKIGSSYYIAMEYVDGHDLKTILKRAEDRHQPMTVELALFVASKVAAALDYAHRRRDFDEKEMSLVHRDVSPQNVLISQEGDIKLCDFGIAKATTKVSHTQVGALKGKLQYMSPEQASGKPIDRRSDIFALGTVLFEMLTGKKLFTGDNEISILEQVREARVTPPSQFNDEVSAEIDRVVFKALQKDPAQRYQSAGEMARDIDSILYTFRPTPTSADLAIYMHHIWGAEPAAPHLDDAEPVTVVDDGAPDLAVAAAVAAPAVTAPAAATPARGPSTTPGGVPMPAWDAPPARAKKRSAAVPLTVAALLVAGIVGAFFYVRSRPTPSIEPVTSSQITSNAAAPAPVPVQTNTAPIVDMTTVAPAPNSGTQPPLLDPTLVQQEVERRLAAERARLEEQARLQQQQQQQPPPITLGGGGIPAASTTTRQPQQAPPPVTQTVAQQPPPAVVPPPVTTTTQAPPAPAETAPAETAPAPATARVREGDLIPPGTEGLVPARVLRRGTVPYPALARQQRVEGTILMNVLISETGQVLEVRVLRGVNRPVGLNEAAEAIMRRSTFSAPMKDGVRVKAWTTVPVDFKL